MTTSARLLLAMILWLFAGLAILVGYVSKDVQPARNTFLLESYREEKKDIDGSDVAYGIGVVLGIVGLLIATSGDERPRSSSPTVYRRVNIPKRG